MASMGSVATVVETENFVHRTVTPTEGTSTVRGDSPHALAASSFQQGQNDTLFRRADL